jgi:hypothetical protein
MGVTVPRKQERKPDQEYKWKLLKEKENKQCCESGSARIRIDSGGLDPDPEEPKMTHKNGKNPETEGFFSWLAVLHESMGINKLQFFSSEKF